MKSQLHPYALAAFFASSFTPNGPAATVAAASPVAAASLRPPALVRYEGFLSRDEIDALLLGVEKRHMPDVADADADSVDTRYSPTFLPRAMVDKLRDLGGTCAESGEAAAPVMTMLMTATTDRHRDCRVPQAAGKVVDDDVAFVFLESNVDAHFEHGDSRVPIVAGTLVKFRGDVPHRTVVPAGSSVRIAGPFHLRSLEYVGSCPEECTDVSDCNGGEFYTMCDCQDVRKLRQLKAKENAMDELEDMSYWDSFIRNVAGAGGGGRELGEMCLCHEGEGACWKDGACEDGIVLADCVRGMWGAFHGAGSTCADGEDPNIKRGACCFFDRTCMTYQASYCEMMTPGHWIGDDKTCAQCPDQNTYGACCFENDCKQLPKDICEMERGGKFKGVDTTCSNDCFGACCSADDCQIVTETGKGTTCTNGIFNGAGTDCMPGGCPTKCIETLSNAGVIPFPEDEISTVPGDSRNGQDYKEYFPECGATILPSNGLWYNLNNNHTSMGDRMVVVSTCSNDVQGATSSYKSSLTVQEGGCMGLECVGSSEDSDNCPNGKGATLGFCAEWSKVYHILVHGFDDYCMLAAGNFTLAVRDDGPCNTDAPTVAPTSIPTEFIDPEERTSTTTSTTTTTTETIEPEERTSTTTSTTTTTETIEPEERTSTTSYHHTSTKPGYQTTTTSHDETIGDCTDLPHGCHNPCHPGIQGFDAYQPFCPWTDNYDPSKYIHCDYWSHECQVKKCCVEGQYWHDGHKQCVGVPENPDKNVGDCTHLPYGCTNPCHNGMQGFDAYQPFCPWTNGYKSNKYFHCDYYGGCQEKECCEEGQLYNDHAKQCI